MKKFLLLATAILIFAKAYPIYMIYIEGGTFEMGDPGSPTASPIHNVTLDYDFYMSETEVIFNDFDYFCWKTDRDFNDDYDLPRDNNPAVYVTWWDAVAFCNWLSEMYELPSAYDMETGALLDTNGNVTQDITAVAGYRLPTEAEWEWAARGGNYDNPTHYSGSDDVNEVSWFKGNSGGTTHQVAGKMTNELGLYDMSGNVVEWCHDWYADYASGSVMNPIAARGTSTDRKVLRGGSWYGADHYGKTYERGNSLPDKSDYYFGFRIARTAIMLFESEDADTTVTNSTETLIKIQRITNDGPVGNLNLR